MTSATARAQAKGPRLRNLTRRPPHDAVTRQQKRALLRRQEKLIRSTEKEKARKGRRAAREAIKVARRAR